MTVTNPDKLRGMKKRASLLLAAYGITLLFLIPHVEYFFFFPFGLFYYFRDSSFLDNTSSFLMIGIGWLFYLAITLLIIFAKQKIVFIILYSILVLLLIGNIGGCHTQINELRIFSPNL